MHLRLTAAAAIAAVSIAAQPASAAVLYDSGQPADTQFGNGLYRDQWLAAALSFSTPVVVSDVETFMFGGETTIALYDDTAGGLPGNQLFSASFTAPAPPNADWVGAHALNWTVGPGTYWFAFEILPTQQGYGGIMGTAPENTALAVDSQPGPWQSLGTFGFPLRVYGAGHHAQPVPLPEPATWALMIAGFGIAGTALRRRAVYGMNP